MIKYISTIIIILLALNVTGQKTKQVTAVGSYASSGDLTMEEITKKAIEDAKKNALVNAGIAENISVSDFLFTFEDNEEFQEIFQAFTSTETGGEIIVDSVLDVSKKFNEFDNIEVTVRISATVYKHKKSKDPELKIKVEGIDNYYNQGDMMRFHVTPSVDGYLKIFNITKKAASILYPYSNIDAPYLNDDRDKLFTSYEKVNFPINQIIGDGYTLEIDDPKTEKEFNLLIFVFTKKDIPYMDGDSVKEIMNWIYSITPDQRTVEQIGFIIQN